METISIYVAAHKKTDITLPAAYKICQVNAEKNGRWTGDYVYDNGAPDNISLKNDRYCELTALYELWKNNDSDIKGLAHYRRFFSNRNAWNAVNFLDRFINEAQAMKRVLREDQIRAYLEHSDIILQYPRNPSIVSAYEDLLRFVFPENIRVLSEVIHSCFPEYEESYRQVLRATNISYLNMFVAKKEVCDAYCSWLFDVLGKTEQRIGGLEDYDDLHRRIFGYMAEVLLNVWVLKHGLRVKYCFTLEAESGRGMIMPLLGETLALKKVFSWTIGETLKVAFRSVPFRFRQTEYAAKNPYLLSIDALYSRLNTYQKLHHYYRAYSHTETGMDSVVADGREISFFRVLQSHEITYSYLQSNFRCIVTLITDDSEHLPAFIEAVRDKYGDRFTVTFRLITRNLELIRFGESHPEIFVYDARDRE